MYPHQWKQLVSEDSEIEDPDGSSISSGDTGVASGERNADMSSASSSCGDLRHQIPWRALDPSATSVLFHQNPRPTSPNM